MAWASKYQILLKFSGTVLETLETTPGETIAEFGVPVTVYLIQVAMNKFSSGDSVLVSPPATENELSKLCPEYDVGQR